MKRGMVMDEGKENRPVVTKGKKSDRANSTEPKPFDSYPHNPPVLLRSLHVHSINIHGVYTYVCASTAS